MKTTLLFLTFLSFTFISTKLKAQTALDLAGPGNYAETAYNLNYGGFTLEYDMYMHNLQNFNAGVTFTCGSNPAPVDFYVNDAGTITSFVGNCGNFHAMNPSLTMTAGTWYNVAHVYPGGGAGIQLYIDGVLVGIHDSFGYNSFGSSGVFRIGTRIDNVTNSDAKYDNVRIWSIPRSGEEVLNDMTACFSGDELGLDILYKMEEGSGTVLNDLALANGAQNATIVGGATWTEGAENPIGGGSMMNVSACDSYESPSGDFTWTESGTYEDRIPSSIVGCDSLITINLIINSVSTSPSISEDVLCLGDTTMLNANSTIVSEFYIGDPNITETNDSESYPCVYGNYYEGAKHQILILASELSAMGMNPGEITGMEFYVDNLNGLTDPLLGLTIKMGHTMVTDLGYTFETPTFVTTYDATDFTVANGAMFHDFSTPFMWDGTSNIVIETCYNNDVLEYTENPSMLYTQTSFISVSYYRADDETSVCSEVEASNYSINRPNFKLVGNTSTTLWSNLTGGIIDPTADMTQAVPTENGIYTLNVSNSLSGCMDNDDQLNVTVNPIPVVDLGDDIVTVNASEILDAGAGFSDYDWSTGESSQTISVSTTGEYIVTVTDGNGCSNSDSIHVAFTAGIQNLDGSMAEAIIFPNPTKGIILLELKGYNDEQLSIELLDVNGKMVQAYEFNNISTDFNTQFDLGNLNEGVYLMKIVSSKSTTTNRVVLKK